MAIFSKDMAAFIAEKVSENQDTFFPPNKSAHFAKKSDEAWSELVEQLTARFGCTATVKQTKEKWFNLKKESKKKHVEEQRWAKIVPSSKLLLKKFLA